MLIHTLLKALFDKDAAKLLSGKPQDLFDFIAQQNKESIMICVTKDSHVRVFVNMDKKKSQLVEALTRVAFDAVKMSAT
jgi:hypothetical protein